MGDTDNSVCGAKRITRTYRQRINARPETVFPLLCPVKEVQWLDGWEYDMVFSRSSFVEEGCVFMTPGDGEADTIGKPWGQGSYSQVKNSAPMDRCTGDFKRVGSDLRSSGFQRFKVPKKALQFLSVTFEIASSFA